MFLVIKGNSLGVKKYNFHSKLIDSMHLITPVKLYHMRLVLSYICFLATLSICGVCLHVIMHVCVCIYLGTGVIRLQQARHPCLEHMEGINQVISVLITTFIIHPAFSTIINTFKYYTHIVFATHYIPLRSFGILYSSQLLS